MSLGRGQDFTHSDDYADDMEELAVMEKRKGLLNFSNGDLVTAKCSACDGKWMDGIVENSFSPGQWVVKFEELHSTEVVRESDMVLGPSKLPKETLANLAPCPQVIDPIRFETRADGKDKICLYKSLVHSENLPKEPMLDVETTESRDEFEDEQGVERRFKNLVLDGGHLKNTHKRPEDDGGPAATREEPKTNSSKAVPAGADDTMADEPMQGSTSLDDESMEQICLMMKMTKEEYLASLESEKVTYDLSSFPSIEELIAESMSAACNSATARNRLERNHDRGRSNFDRSSGPHRSNFQRNSGPHRSNWGQTTRGRGRGRGLHPFGHPDDFKIPTNKPGMSSMNGGQSSDLGEQVNEILSKEDTCTNQLCDIMDIIGISCRMIYPEHEGKVKFCLNLLVDRCSRDGRHVKLCVEFFGQIVAKTKNIQRFWNGAFWPAYKSIVEGVDLSRMKNFSSFLAGVQISSRYWLDENTREQISHDLLTCLDKIISMIVQLEQNGPKSSEQEEMIGFVSNFLSTICEVRKNSRQSKDGEVKFLENAKRLVESSNLPRHIFNLFMTFLDISSIFRGHTRRKWQGPPEEPQSSAEFPSAPGGSNPRVKTSSDHDRYERSSKMPRMATQSFNQQIFNHHQHHHHHQQHHHHHHHRHHQQQARHHDHRQPTWNLNRVETFRPAGSGDWPRLRNHNRNFSARPDFAPRAPKRSEWDDEAHW